LTLDPRASAVFYPMEAFAMGPATALARERARDLIADRPHPEERS